MTQKEIWEGMPDVYAHRKLEKWLGDWTHYKAYYKKHAIDRLGDLTGKTIVDYGCGGGYTGKILLESKIKKYIGVDISTKSCKSAILNIGKGDRVEIINGETVPDCEILISIAVIQCLPDEKAYNELMEKINNSKAEKVLLQYRYGKKKYRKASEVSINDIVHSCYTNAEDIAAYLTSYELVSVITDDKKERLDYALFERKKNSGGYRQHTTKNSENGNGIQDNINNDAGSAGATKLENEGLDSDIVDRPRLGQVRRDSKRTGKNGD